MRRITLWLLMTVTIVVLLFSYHTSTNQSTIPSVATVNGSAATESSPSSSSGTGPDPDSSSGASGSDTSTSDQGSVTSGGTFTGSAVNTRWGPVQVQITVANGTITDVTVPVYPTSDQRDIEINSQALPILIQETIDGQSAQIDMVSGATVTSVGYIQSLQEAIDQANLQ